MNVAIGIAQSPDKIDGSQQSRLPDAGANPADKSNEV